MLAEVVWREMLKTKEVWMELVTQMALKGTRASEAWERQVQARLEPQSRHMYLTLQDLAEMPCQAWADRPWQGLVDMPCLGQPPPGLGGNTVPGPGGHVAPGPGGTPPRAQEDTSGHDLVDMLHWDLVAMCRPWPEDQEATFSICILFEERRGIGPGRNGPTVDNGMERKQSAWG